MNILTQDECDAYLAALLTDQTPTGGTPTSVIADVSARIARYTGRKDWGPQASYTEYHNGGTNLLLVSVWPIISITSISDDINHVWDTGSIIDSATYWISQNANLSDNDGIIYFDAGQLSCGNQNIKLIYTGGYASSADVPTDIKTAGNMQIAFELQMQEPGRYRSFPGRNQGDVPDSYSDFGLLGEVRALLTKYQRRIPFA